MPIHQQYTRELRERFGYSATWIPSIKLSLGDVGRLAGYQFERIGNLRDYGLKFRSGEGKAIGSIDYASASGVEISTRTTAELPAEISTLSDVNGSATVKFTRQGAVLFNAQRCTTGLIENREKLEAQILDLYEKGQWSIDNVFITELVHSEAVTVLIAGGKDAVIDLRGEAKTWAASVGQDLRVAKSHNMSTQVIAMGGLTPLFRASGVRKRLLRRASVTTRGGEQNVAMTNSPFFIGEVGYENFS